MIYKRGLTIVELIIVLAIFITILAISLSVFPKTSQSKQLETQVDAAASVVTEARTKSTASVDNSEFGIRFASSSITQFKGTAYSSGGVVTSYNLSSGVSIQSIAISGGGNDLYFSRITGEPSGSATIVFRHAGNASSTKTMTVLLTGLIEVQ